MFSAINKSYLIVFAVLVVGIVAVGYVSQKAPTATSQRDLAKNNAEIDSVAGTEKDKERAKEYSSAAEQSILVKFTEEALAMDALAQHPVLVDIGVTQIKTFTYAGNTSVLLFDAQKTTEEVIATIEASGLVEYAEPDYIVHAESSTQKSSIQTQTDLLSWGLHNTGTTGGTEDADIDAPEAWLQFAKIPKSHPSNTPRPVIAVIDTGVDFTHAGLTSHLWRNSEATVVSQKSDSGDAFGINTCGRVGRSTLVNDTHGHGTQVAGVIASLNKHREFTLLPIKALCDEGRGYHSSVIAAVDYVLARKQQGVNISVANLSFGGSDGGNSLLLALQQLAQHNVVIVTSAGNDGQSNDETPRYPSNYPIAEMIVVAASDHNDQLSSTTNYGISTVDLAAPGVDIYTTQLNGMYGEASGTSLAAAHISGSAAMAQIVYPSLSAINIKSRIMVGADKRNQFSDKLVSRGRLNTSNIFYGRAAGSQFVENYPSLVDREQHIRSLTPDASNPRDALPVGHSASTQVSELDIVAHHIMMRFADTYKGYSLEERSALLEPFGVSIEKDFPYAGGSVLLSINGAPRAPSGRLPEGETKESVHERINSIIEKLQDSGLVEYAEPDGIVKLTAAPNDTRYGELWGLETIQAESAVDHIDQAGVSPTEVVIAVVDTGIDYNHADLADHMWVNVGEIPGDGIDNDYNGYIDDVHGINTRVDDLSDPRVGDPMDEGGHGTHVAGTIGAVRNNALGVAGVTPYVRLMALKMFQGDRSGAAISDAVEALNYVHEMKVSRGVNVKLTNHSWGGGPSFESLRAAIEVSSQHGILFVAAAGNDGINTDLVPHYPSGYDVDNVISVTSTDSGDLLSWFSNYGDNVDIAAPGSSILSTLPNNGYGYNSGTSMAAPHVSGVLGLMFSAKPNLSIEEAKSIILDNADPVSSLDGFVNSSRRLNAYSAIFDDSVLEISNSVVIIEENGLATVNVRLLADQLDTFSFPVTVEIEKSQGDETLVLSSPSTLVFDSSNWDTWQSVNFLSTGDLDVSNDSAIFHISILGNRGKNITVNELDNGVLPDNICDAVSQIPNSECAALVALYESTDGANWTNNDGWLSTATPCSWHGIICSLDGHVSNIFLGSNNLQGEFPNIVSAFTKLQYLSLYSNNLSGSLDASLGSLADLRVLQLSSNRLTGAIPSEIGNLSQLERLYLGNNLLSGAIPSSIGSLVNLLDLSLYSNQLTGDIPLELTGLSQLQQLDLSGNQLTGSLPETLGNLSNLSVFNVSFNQISGSLPSSLGNLTNLLLFYADNNQLTGQIPSNIGDMSQLSRIWLQNNQLTGEVPDSFYALINLTDIYLTNNQLSGEVSSLIGNMSQVSWVNIANNQFSGILPDELGNLFNLGSIDVSNNQLTGTIPAALTGLINLYYLNLSNNQFGGAIPSNVGELSSLSFLYLSNNQLTGVIPSTVGNLTGLFDLDLSYNLLNGSIPSEIANLALIYDLRLNNNQLTGSIPSEIGGMTQLFTLNLNNNLLSGSIPAELGNLTNLWALYLQENALTGSIPPSLSNLSSLSRMYLYSNQLTGSIPPELGSMSRVYRIYLYDNQLTGSIPPELGSMTNASRFYFYDNQLSGEIPAELGSAPGLYRVLLQNNRLSGAIPPELGESATISRLLVSNNQLSGEVTEAIANLFIVELGYNSLEAESVAAANSLDIKDPGWDATQTLAPENISALVSNGQTFISWTPIDYSIDQGEYIISYADSPSGPFTEHGRVADKSSSMYLVDDAASHPNRFYAVQSRTLPHGDQQNDIVSGVSETVQFDNIVNPSITLPSMLTLDAFSENGFDAAYPLIEQFLSSVTAVDKDGNFLVVTHNAPAIFLVGINEITFEACDLFGNCSTATQTVTVEYDPAEPAPSIVAPADVIVEAVGASTPVTLGLATATDLVDGALTPTPSEVGPFAVGTYQVLWSATNSVGKTTVAAQTVTVQDTIAPELIVPDDVTAMGRIDFDTGVATATDLFATTIENDAPAFFPFGTTSITWTATDANGNVSTAEQTVTLNPYHANHSSQIACEAGENADTVWAIDPDNDTVSMITVSRNPLTSERVVEAKNNFFMFTDSKPSSITRVNNYVATTYADTGSIRFNQVDFPWIEGGTVPWTTWKLSLRNDMPVASVGHNNMLYVALYASGEVIKIDTETRQIVSRLKVGPKPKAMALTSDGARLLVTRFISTSEYGEVYDINTEGNMSFRDPLQPSIHINKVWVPDDIDHGSGVPNYLRSIVIDSDNQFAYVSANKANIERGQYLSGEALSADNTVRSMIAVLDLSLNSDTNIDSLTRENTNDLLNAADPSGLGFLPDANTGIYALQGNNRVALYDFAQEDTISTVDVGYAPQSLCVTEDWLYVKNHTDRTVSVIDIDSYIQSNNTALSSEQVALVEPENDVLSATELQGLQLFYSANNASLSPEGYMSCASCHDDGGHDGMTWDFTHMGEGLRNTPSLRGSSGARFGLLNWSGSADEVQDIEKQLEQLHGSNGFIAGINFSDQTPLEHASLGRATELDALSDYVSSLGKQSVMKSPNYCEWGDNECWSTYYSGAWQYHSHGCKDCHARDSRSSGAYRDGMTHDMGTITEASGLSAGLPLEGIRTPTLIELWDTAPYLHDGSAETLEEVMSTGVHATYGLDEREMRNLIQFINNIDRSQYIGDDELFNP